MPFVFLGVRNELLDSTCARTTYAATMLATMDNGRATISVGLYDRRGSNLQWRCSLGSASLYTRGLWRRGFFRNWGVTPSDAIWWCRRWSLRPVSLIKSKLGLQKPGKKDVLIDLLFWYQYPSQQSTPCPSSTSRFTTASPALFTLTSSVSAPARVAAAVLPHHASVSRYRIFLVLQLRPPWILWRVSAY